MLGINSLFVTIDWTSFSPVLSDWWILGFHSEFRQKNAGKRAVTSKSKEEKKKQKVEGEASKKRCGKTEKDKKNEE